MNIKKTIALLLMALLASNAAVADVGGDVNVTVDVQGATVTTAGGLQSNANTYIGAVTEPSDVGGDFRVRIDVTGAVTTTAVGAFSSAETFIGTVNEDVGGDFDAQVAITGAVITTAAGRAEAVTCIASIGCSK